MLTEVLAKLAALGVEVEGAVVIYPDGTRDDTRRRHAARLTGPERAGGCLHPGKTGRLTVLLASILYFPAFWMLSEKAGRPVSAIHHTVP